MTVLTLMFFVPSYETNDDYFMGAISSGVFGKEYSPYIVFSNIVYGYILKFLGFLCGKLNWYVVVQYIYVCAAITIIFYVISQRVSIYITVVFNMFFWYVCFFEQIRRIQFTRTAGIVSLAGFLLIFCLSEQKHCKSKILGYALCVMGSWIRFECFGVCAVFFCMLGLCLCIEGKKINKAKFYILLHDILIVIGVVLLFVVIDKGSYQINSEWKEYKKYNQVRADLLDYGVPEWENNRENYEKLGISQNDYEMLRNWYIEDYEKFDYETLVKIVSFREKAHGSVWDCLLDFCNRISINKLFYIWLLLILFLLFSFNNSNCKLFSIMNIVCICGMYGCLYYMGRVKPRVEFVIWISYQQ